ERVKDRVGQCAVGAQNNCATSEVEFSNATAESADGIDGESACADGGVAGVSVRSAERNISGSGFGQRAAAGENCADTWASRVAATAHVEGVGDEIAGADAVENPRVASAVQNDRSHRLVEPVQV